MKFIKRVYDKSYFNTWLERTKIEEKFNRHKIKLIRSVKPSGKLLEIGCGRGKLLNNLKEDYSVLGTDISSAAIDEASKLMDKRLLEVSNIEKDSIKGKYDLILAFDVLEHLKNPKKAIVKIKKALRKGGIFIFSVPNNYGLFGKFATAFFNYSDRTHISTYKRARWIKLIKDSGFHAEVYNQHQLGISRLNFTKYFAFNLVMVCTKK